MKSKAFKRVVIASALALVLAACGEEKAKETVAVATTPAETTQSVETTQAPAAAKTVTIKHASGETVVPFKPEKVITFDFGMLDTLETLDVDVIGIPKANMPSYLTKYESDKYQNFGTLKEPNFEAIHAAKPDLIIISLRQAALYDQFAEIAPTVNLALDEANYLESATSNIKTLGEIFGQESEVEKEVKELNDKVAKVREQTAKMDETALVMLVNDGKISVYGPGSRFGVIHDVLGVKPADSTIAQSRHGQTASFEYVMDLNPDFIFVVDRSAVIAGNGNSGAKEVVENELVKNTNAYKNGKIIYLDPNVWYLSGGGYKSTNQMIDDVQKAIAK